MHALVVYESMYGNTHTVAEALAGGLRPNSDVRVVPVHDATAELIDWADLVIVGGPTHVHGMTRAKTRVSAREAVEKPGNELTLDPEAAGPGVRDWIESLPEVQDKRAAAFDTRMRGPALLTGHASGGIAKGLRLHGFRLVAEPQSFLVDRHTQLVPGEADRATEWGAQLAGES